MRVGAHYLGEGRCEFVVWAPRAANLSLRILSPGDRVIPMLQAQGGYWRVVAEDVQPGAPYLYRLDDAMERPDPASHLQEKSVHGPSMVVDHRSFRWDDRGWQGIPLEKMIIYELHVGTFTPEGSFDAIIPRLPDLIDLGVNAIELMPVAQFPGARNWGYDGVYPYAVQNTYGGPEGLKRLVNACHREGVAVLLDVVYNHLGPEGNYLSTFGPYFTEKYRTPWGMAINFDDAHSDDVRNYFIGNALHWFGNYHIDGLRLDAIHAIYDMSAKPFLQELAERTDEFSMAEGRKFHLMAESDRNDVRVILPRERGGYGIHAQWSDDFHHSLRTVLTDERLGYYEDFGLLEDLATAWREGFVYSWRYSAHRRRHHGSNAKDRPGHQLIVSCQNHDQVGNRMLGERLSALVSFEALKVAAATVLLSPYVPLLFMGEEYGEETPFLYFVSHSDGDLVEAVRKGRKEEFRAFSWQGEPPDPQSEETFDRSVLHWEARKTGSHGLLLDFYRELIRLRREIPALADLSKEKLDVRGNEEERLLVVQRWRKGDDAGALILFNFGRDDAVVAGELLPDGRWRKILDTADSRWRGPGTSLPVVLQREKGAPMRAESAAIYLKEDEA